MKGSAPRWLLFASLMSLMWSPAYADTFFDAGTTAYGRGDTGKAIELWFQSGDPRAQHMLGIMARTGKLKGCDPVHCAAGWFYKAADNGYLPAFVELAALLINNGHMEEGVEILKGGARWNDADCRRILGEMGRPVPAADLYEQAMAQRRQAELRAQAQAQQERERAEQARQAERQQQWTEQFLYGLALGSMATPSPQPEAPKQQPRPASPQSFSCSSSKQHVTANPFSSTFTCQGR